MQPPVGELETLHMYNDHGSVVSHERSEVRFGREGMNWFKDAAVCRKKPTDIKRL